MKLATLWVATWIGAAGLGIWFTEARYLVPKGKDPQDRRALRVAPAVRPRALFFWSPGCPCSRDVEPEMKAYAEKLSGAVDFEIVVIDPAKLEERVKAWKEIKIPISVAEGDPFLLAKKYEVPASPGAVVFDRQGKLVYRGGFNVARFCHNEETAFVAHALKAVTTDRVPKVKEGPFFGCGIGNR